MSDDLISLIVVIFVDDTNLYTWKEEITDHDGPLASVSNRVRTLELSIERYRGGSKT